MEKTTLYLPADIQHSLRVEARRSGRPQAELVREALRVYLADRPAVELRSVGVGKDKSVSGRDSEAWLRRKWNKKP
jgi:predicted DNA-binding protein